MRKKYFFFIDLILLVLVIMLFTYRWFSLGFSEYELTAMTSRIWDIKSQILICHHFPSWTQFYMSGSSYTLWHSQWLLTLFMLPLSFFCNLEVAAKLVILVSLLGSALIMYGLILVLFKNRAAAFISATVYSLHPIQMLHAAKWEHVGISLYYPLIPLVFLFFIRAVQTKSVRYIIATSFTLMFMLANSNEQTMIIAGFMFFFCIFVSLWGYKKEKLILNAKIYPLILAGALFLGTFFIIPGIVEKNYCKLFLGDPLAGWRQTYSLKSILFLFNRDGIILNPVLNYLHPILRMESTGKYFGLIPFMLIITAFLVKKKREHGMLFWFAVSSFVLSLMAASGVFSIFGVNFIALKSLLRNNAPFVGILPVFLVFFAIVLALGTFLYKIRTSPKKIIFFLGILALILFFKPFWVIQRLPFFKHMRCPYYFLDIAGVFFFAFLCSFFVLEVLSKIKRKCLYHIATYALFALIVFDYFPYTKHFRRNNILLSVREDLKTTYQTIGKDPENIKVYYLSGHYYNLLGPMYSGKPLVYEAYLSWMCPKGLGVLFASAQAGLQGEFFNLTSAKYIVLEKADKNTYGRIKKGGLLDAYQKAYPLFLENESFMVLQNPHYKPYVQRYDSKALYIGNYVASGKLSLFLSAKNVSLVQGELKSLKEYPLDYLDSFDYIFYNKAYDEDTDYLLKIEEEFKNKFYDLTANPYLEIESMQRVEFKDVMVTRVSSDEVKVHLISPENTILMLSESHYPRWQVSVNGKKDKLLRINCGFMGAEVKEGENELVFKYVNPWYYKIAYLISIVAFVVMVALLKKPSLVQKNESFKFK